MTHKRTQQPSIGLDADEAGAADRFAAASERITTLVERAERTPARARELLADATTACDEWEIAYDDRASAKTSAAA